MHVRLSNAGSPAQEEASLADDTQGGEGKGMDLLAGLQELGPRLAWRLWPCFLCFLLGPQAQGFQNSKRFLTPSLFICTLGGITVPIL